MKPIKAIWHSAVQTVQLLVGCKVNLPKWPQSLHVRECYSDHQKLEIAPNFPDTYRTALRTKPQLWISVHSWVTLQWPVVVCLLCSCLSSLIFDISVCALSCGSCTFIIMLVVLSGVLQVLGDIRLQGWRTREEASHQVEQLPAQDTAGSVEKSQNQTAALKSLQDSV